MKKRILNLVNSKEFQALNSYYGEKTMFSALNLERNENRHSAFIAWWLNPNSDHGLGEAPMKLFLRLVASKSELFDGLLLTKILSGGYDLNLKGKIELEKSLSSLGLKSNYRMDIWSVLSIKYDDEESERIIPLVIENKIYSKERKGQTQDYYDGMNTYFLSEGLPIDVVVGVLLSPKEIKPECDAFVCVTYQELLDYVIEPLMSNVIAEKVSFVESFVRNLGRPALGVAKDYSVLAISQKEYNMIEVLRDKDKELFDMVFATLYADDVKKIMGDDRYQEIVALLNVDEMENIFRELWNEYESVFKSVVYFNYKESHDVLNKLFKPTNRDTTRYKVTHKGTEIFPQRRLSKSLAACAIFKAYLKEYPAITLDELREAFPGNLNGYYYNHFFNDLFYIFDEPLELTAGKHKGKEVVNISTTWDFYLDEEKLLSIENKTKKVMMVKMWRKSDFDNLVAHTCEYYPFIEIEEI